MSETFQEQVSRMQQMIEPQSKWDLSENDRLAITAVLNKLDENQEKAIDDWVDQSFRFAGAGPTPNGFELRIKAGKIAKVFAVCFAEILKDRDVNNYVEMSVHHPEQGLINVIVLKPGGKTPHQLRQEVEVERDKYKLEAAKFNHMLNQLFHKPTDIKEGSTEHQDYVLSWYAKAKETMEDSFLNKKEPPNDQY